MNKFSAEGGQFLLNGEPVLIHAGEFHYFRTPRDQWQHRLGLLKDAGFNAVACYIPWLWHQLEEDGSDFDGHSNPMRDLEGFLDLAAGMGFYIIARPGPYIMAETNHEGIPAWVFEKYPCMAFINQNQQAQNIASYLHPEFLACVKKWYRAIFAVLTPRQITRGGKIIMVQLDNEMGMMPWVRNAIDINPDTLDRFAAFLEATCRERQPGRYPSEGLAEFLRVGIVDPTGDSAAMIVEDYRRFYRQYLREYAVFLIAEAQANGMDVLPVINIHGFGNGGKTFPIGLSQLISVMELDGMISATDVYPLFIGEGTYHQLLLVNEMTKALQNPRQALFSIEFQSGGVNDFSNGQASMFDLHTRLCISIDMRAINHYLFFDGENDPLLSPVKRHDWGHPVRKDGSLRKIYYRYPKLSRVLNTYGVDLVNARNQTVTTVGFVLDTYMTEVNTRATQEATNILTHQRDDILFDFLARGLALTHRPFDALELSRCQLDPARTPLLWVMMEQQCDGAVQQKLVDFVRQGGRLVLAGRMCVEDIHHQPCTILKDALGITDMRTDPPFTSTNINALGYDDIPVSFVECYSGAFDEVIATTQAGETVGFVERLGSGSLLFFGAALTANTLDDLDVFERIAQKMGCQPLFRLSDWADVRINHGDRGSFVYINNYQDDPVEMTIQYRGESLFGGSPVGIPARRGLILPLEWQAREGVTIHYATAEITGMTEDEAMLTITTEPAEFTAELALDGYTCDQADATQRGIKVSGKDGKTILRRSG